MPQSQTQTYLNSLKGISILLIIAMHCGISSLPGIIGTTGSNFGTMGVSMFMLISGYLAFLSFSKSETGITKWYLKRYLRLFPLYIMATIITLLTGTYSTYWLGNKGRISIPNILSHILFMHGLFPHYCNSILGIEWYLGALFLYYLVTPILYKYIRSLESSIIALLISLLATPIINSLIYKIMPITSDPVIYEAYKNTFSPIRLFPVYVLGITLYFLRLKINMQSIQHKKALSYTLIVFSIIMIIGQMLDANTLFHFSNYSMFAMWFGIIIIALSLSNNIVLDNPVFKLIGEYSYAMYLFQYLLINAYDTFMPKQLGFTVRFIVITVIVFASSILVTIFIDRPLQKRLSRLLKL